MHYYNNFFQAVKTMHMLYVTVKSNSNLEPKFMPPILKVKICCSRGIDRLEETGTKIQ